MRWKTVPCAATVPSHYLQAEACQLRQFTDVVELEEAHHASTATTLLVACKSIPQYSVMVVSFICGSPCFAT
jgi:hypothetical protein